MAFGMVQSLLAGSQKQTENIQKQFARQRGKSELAFERGKQFAKSPFIQSAIGDLATGEFSTDAERLQLTRKLAELDPVFASQLQTPGKRNMMQDILDTEKLRQGLGLKGRLKVGQVRRKAGRDIKGLKVDREKMNALETERTSLDEAIKTIKEKTPGTHTDADRRELDRLERQAKRVNNQLATMPADIESQIKTAGAAEELASVPSRSRFRGLRKDFNRIVPGKKALQTLIQQRMGELGMLARGGAGTGEIDPLLKQQEEHAFKRIQGIESIVPGFTGKLADPKITASSGNVINTIFSELQAKNIRRPANEALRLSTFIGTTISDRTRMENMFKAGRKTLDENIGGIWDEAIKVRPSQAGWSTDKKAAWVLEKLLTDLQPIFSFAATDSDNSDYIKTAAYDLVKPVTDAYDIRNPEGLAKEIGVLVNDVFSKTNPEFVDKEKKALRKSVKKVFDDFKSKYGVDPLTRLKWYQFQTIPGLETIAEYTAVLEDFKKALEPVQRTGGFLTTEQEERLKRERFPQPPPATPEPGGSVFPGPAPTPLR